MKYLTLKYLEKVDACNEAIKWFKEIAPKGRISFEEGFKLCIKQNNLDWAGWIIARKLNRLDKIRYAVYVASQVIKIYEDNYPGDDRPRKAIQAAKRYLKNPSIKNKNAANAAANAASAAANAAYAADAASAAAYAASAASAAYAADAASAAAYAASAASAAYAADAAYAAAYAASAAKRKELQIKICKYGLKLLFK